jgi:hypothetical protein
VGISETGQWVLVRDDDGHWFLIDYESLPEFNQWVAWHNEEYWERDFAEEWEGYNFAKDRLNGGPGSIIITGWRQSNGS